ncbi:hypothetical protein ACP275_10G167100 [Erythranthe tilingii]
MENRRRRNWESNRRSQNRRPPRGSCNWQPIVPSWEKEFCRVVGSLDWETLLQMKKFVHLYENVLKWDDSAVEEAFSNAKKRFWAEINGLPCDISLPDPDQYIDTIDWDSQINYVPDLELEPVISNADQEHDPVIIFGDSLLPNQAYSSTGWGDEEENFKLPANSSSVNNNGAEWEQKWGDSFDNVAPIGWSGDSINACHFGDEDGWNNNDWDRCRATGHGELKGRIVTEIIICRGIKKRHVSSKRIRGSGIRLVLVGPRVVMLQ